jgi:plasmid stabilization system protein ParE
VKIRWTRLARADIDAAYEYVAADNEQAADRFLETIAKAAAVRGCAAELLLLRTCHRVGVHLLSGWTSSAASQHGFG